jgi:hypothetical protein
MTIETAPRTSTVEEACPSWCTGRHLATGTEAPRYWHLSADCPPWCVGHSGHVRDLSDEAHVSTRDETELSLAEPYELDPGDIVADYIETSVWQMPDAPAPEVTIFHAAKEDYLPGMTPAEAMALAADLVRAAGAAAATQVPGSTGTSCPPWCAYGPCDPDDAVHISVSHVVPVTEHVFCSYMRDRAAGRMTDRTAGPCEEKNSAELVLGEDGLPLLSLHHGDDCLPYMTLGAAETFALSILELVSAGRTSSPAGSLGSPS